MAFDGSAIRALVYEFNKELTGSHISKIAQTEKDELIITVKDYGRQTRLLISVNPSLPVIYLTDENKTAPLQAPAFCMLLRKHLQGGQIISVTQPSLERIIDFEIEHYNEMGDLCRKILTVELMGKHSNIIFRDGTKILDSIRHVSGLVSSVREVLPGREYFIPFSGDKINPLESASIGIKSITDDICTGSEPLYKSIYSHITGFSPALSEEIVYNAGLDGSVPAGSLDSSGKNALSRSLLEIFSILENNSFSPCIYGKGGIPEQFCPWKYNIFSDYDRNDYDSMSKVLVSFYRSRQTYVGIRQKTADLRQIVSGLLAKDYKKYDLQSRQIKDTEKKDKYKVYGELLTAYGYSVENGATSFSTTDFYSGEEVTIPLDPTLSAIENGKKYFEKYSKLKRTYENLSAVIEETSGEIEHLESISASLDTALNEADIADIRREMSEAGFIRSKAASGKAASGKGGRGKDAGRAVKSAPLHFVSSDGFDIFVGKNNYQNEYITFKVASGDDWWFHAKKRPGSHVIVKCGGREVPDKTFEEAASLAAHFSKSDGASKIEVDYAQRKFIKKPAGAHPGFVIYHTNFSMTASGDISGIQELN